MSNNINSVVDTMKALGNPSRLAILGAVRTSGSLNVSAICAIIGASQPAVSIMLKDLQLADLIGKRRDGKSTFITLNDEHPLIGVVHTILDASGAGAAPKKKATVKVRKPKALPEPASN